MDTEISRYDSESDQLTIKRRFPKSNEEEKEELIQQKKSKKRKKKKRQKKIKINKIAPKKRKIHIIKF
jgi:hypothetical protein